MAISYEHYMEQFPHHEDFVEHDGSPYMEWWEHRRSGINAQTQMQQAQDTRIDADQSKTS